jgi:hypothetical protein
MKVFFSGVWLIVSLVAGFAIVIFGLRHLEQITNISTKLADLALAISLFCLILSIIPSARRFAGRVIFHMSYLLGLNVWLGGVWAVYMLWGLVPLIAALLFFGVGPVPLGLLALIFHGRNSDAGMLLVSLVVMLITRFAGAYIAASGDNYHEKKMIEQEIIADWKQSQQRGT